jgi:mRNA-degrading endonuclease RelE of RelBE toxin-antitoxin system
MPSEASALVTVRFTPEFKRDLRALSKKYRHIRSDYRIIYYLRTPSEAILVTLYSKSEQSDVSTAQIRRIVKGFESAG